MIQTTLQLKEEFAVRAQQCGLELACPADGSFHSEIAIVAEAPGENEVIKKIPLVGASGQKLWQTLRKFGVTRMDTYITNVAKRQVSFGRDLRMPINKHELHLWNELLLWELSQLPNLKYVVALGNFALSALCGKQGITSWRGSVLDAVLSNARKVKVLSTFNPAMILREPRTELPFTMDLSKLRRVLDGTFKSPQIITTCNPTYAEAMDYLDAIQKEGKEHETPIAFDIEVISKETACVGFANNATNAMCINWRTLDEQRYTIEQERLLRLRMQQLFIDPDLFLVAQNASFDSCWLWYKDRIRVLHVWFDTMLAHHTLYPTLPHNLGFLTTQYTDHPYYKDEKDEWREGGNINEFWEYNGRDCCNTWAVAQREHIELARAKLDDFFFDHVMRLQPHLIRMTVGGIKIDTSLKELISSDLQSELSRRLADFHASVSTAIRRDRDEEDYRPNPRSPHQMSDLFFRRLGLVGRGTSTDAINRQRMLAHPRTSDAAKEVIRRADRYLENSKFFSTYADMEIDPDSRARCEYKQSGTQNAPGRLSSSKVMWGSGMNLQNQPDRAHPMFIADPGYGLGYFDMAQAEARLVAYFANIPKWKEQFERARIDGSYDAHRALASEMFNLPYDEVPAYDRVKRSDGTFEVTLRFIAKRCRHGLNYRMGPERLAETTGLPLPQAYDAYRAYHRSTPELRPWWAALEREVTSTHMLFNAYGRRWFLMERITPEALESIVAYKPQSTLGDHVTRVMYLAEDDDEWPYDARMWLNNHDSLICHAPLAKVDHCMRIMKRYAEAPIQIGLEQLIIPADTKKSYPDEHGIHRWSTLKPYPIEV